MGNYPAALGELHALQGLMGKQSSSEKPASRRRQGEKQSIFFSCVDQGFVDISAMALKAAIKGGDLCAGADF